MPRGGVGVIQLDRVTIEDLYDLRTVLEVYAIKMACRRITPEQVVSLKQVRVQAMELMSHSTLNKEFMLGRLMELNTEFHEYIYKASGSRFLININNQLRGIVQGIRSISLQADQAPTRAWKEHDLLIAHLEKCDIKAAQILIRKHIKNAADEVLSVMKKKAQKGMSV
jgi:DNA-binding GntR family transcriptional regulator